MTGSETPHSRDAGTAPGRGSRSGSGAPRDDAIADEYERIHLLVERDGHTAARSWVERTLQVYVDAVASPSSHASITHYRPLFEASIDVFRQWLREHSPGPEAND